MLEDKDKNLENPISDEKNKEKIETGNKDKDNSTEAGQKEEKLPTNEENLKGSDSTEEDSEDQLEKEEEVKEKKTSKSDKEIEKELEERKNELKNKIYSGMNSKLKMKKSKLSFKGLIMLVFIITILLSLPNMMADRNKTPAKEVSYSEFIDLSKTKELSSVEEKDGFVYGRIGEGESLKVYKTRMITNRLGQDEKLVKTLENNNIKIKSTPPEELPFILSLLASWFPMLILIGVWFFMLNKMNKGGGGSQIFSMGKSKAKENGEEISDVTFKDVAGIDEAKQELKEVVEFLKEPEKFRKLGAKIPKGVLLLGNPGTGKTLLAKAVAGEAKVPFFSMSGSEFVEMFVGVGASRVRDLFAKARKSAPCIIFIDEIDAVGRKRGSGQGGGNDEREQTLNQLLVEMDGFGTGETIIVLAATNRPDVLDRALRRPGRFDRQVVVDPPDIKGRKAILEVHAKNKKFADDVDFETLARKTVGLVGADLANILNEAAILAAREGRTDISMADLEEASEKVEMGSEKRSKVVSEKEKLKTAYHEAGHAVINYLYMNDTDPVHKVTIIPRGMAGGYTMALPNEDRYYYSKKWFINKMKMCYGGRAADEIVSQEVNTGASQDIKVATSIAQGIVTKYGMNDKFGPILLDGTNDGDMFQQKYYSDITGKEVDEEIIRLVKETYAETVQALKDNREKLDNLAHALCERETVMRKEFEALMRGEELPPLVLASEEVKEEEVKEEKTTEEIVEETTEEAKEETKEEKE